MPKTTILRHCLALAFILPTNTPVAEESPSPWLSDSHGCKAYLLDTKPGDSIQWSGTCQEEKLHGEGALTLTRNNTPYYIMTATFTQGKAQGAGTIRYTNGNLYEGTLKDSVASGEGTFSCTNGVQYQGQFEQGKLSGKGILRFENGSRYEGEFVDGKTSGKGMTLYANGDRYEGDYLDGKINGTGVHISKDGRRYQGEFVNSQPHGKGLMQLLDGQYEGEFNHGELTGKGRFTWSNGISYSGDFIHGKPADTTKFTLPEIVNKPKLAYPDVMLRSGNTGKVLIKIITDDQGKVSSVETLQSHHPAFERMAIETILKSRIKPASVEGHPVPSVFTIPFTFQFGLGNTLPFNFNTSDLSKLPEKFRFDTPPTDSVVAPLVYPFELIKKGVTGSATVSVVVDPAGRTREVSVIKATHEAFGLATKAMFDASVYTPARKDKKAVWSSFTFTQTFSRGDRDIHFDKHMLRILGQLQSDHPALYKLDALDHPPKALYTPAPAYPEEYQKSGTQKILLEFYIDKTGHVQLPHIIQADNVHLAWLGMTTVSRWLFEPPSINGQAVDAIARLPMVFDTPPAQ